jgi:hypothetical protein
MNLGDLKALVAVRRRVSPERIDVAPLSNRPRVWLDRRVVGRDPDGTVGCGTALADSRRAGVNGACRGMTGISSQPTMPGRLSATAIVLVVAITAAGGYAWWRWGPLVALDALARFCL